MKRLNGDKIKSITAVAVLVAITIIAFEIPRGIYIQNDKSLMKNVTVSEYSMDVVTETMDISEKIDALKKNDTIMVELEYGDEVDLSGEAKASHIKYLIREVDDMLHYVWSSQLQCVFYAYGTESDLYALEVITVEDDKIYSYNLGILIFYNDDFHIYADMPGVVLFDMETDKIIYLEVMGYDTYMDPGYRDAIYGEYNVTISDIDENGNLVYEYSEYSENDESLAEKNKYKLSYYNDLMHYYDISLTANDMAYITEYSVCACPFSVEDMSSKAMTAVLDYVYEYSSKIN